MCPNCRAFITTDDKVCPYCEAVVAPRAVDVRNPGEVMGGLIPHAHFTTIVILLINAGMYVATELHARNLSVPGPFVQSLRDLGAKYGPFIEGGQWWRLVTAGFLHGGLMHILMNSWALFDLGAQVEEAYGTRRYLVLYLVTTVAGFWLSYQWQPYVTSIGASAGIFGLIGAMIALGVRQRHRLGDEMRQFYIRWAVYGFALGFFFNADHGAHLGGVAAGFLVGYVAGTPRLVGGMREQFWRVAAILSVLIAAVAFALMFRYFLQASR